MNILIVESKTALAQLWCRHLERLGAQVFIASTQDEATNLIAEHDFEVIVLDLVLPSGSALAVSDFANYRRPNARVVFVTNTSFFSDGSIFRHCANACAFLPSTTPPKDLATMIDHYAHLN